MDAVRRFDMAATWFHPECICGAGSGVNTSFFASQPRKKELCFSTAGFTMCAFFRTPLLVVSAFCISSIDAFSHTGAIPQGLARYGARPFLCSECPVDDLVSSRPTLRRAAVSSSKHWTMMQTAPSNTRWAKRGSRHVLRVNGFLFRPPVGFVDLLTKYSWGQQDPGIPLPIDAIPGQVKEEGWGTRGCDASKQPPEPTNAVTKEHLETLYRDGVVHIPGVLDEKWVQYLRAIENPHIWAVPGRDRCQRLAFGRKLKWRAGVASGLYDYIQRSAWTTNSGELIVTTCLSAG
eukprot:748844-Hanusia_phi.AAC.1